MNSPNNHHEVSLGKPASRFHEDDLSDVIDAQLAPLPSQPDVIPGWAVDSLESAWSLCDELRRGCRAMVQGRDPVIDLILVALLADGHVLLEDHPGSGKTTLAKTLGGAIAREPGDDRVAPFRRVQFTPDLLPSDVTGTTMFDPEAHTFAYHPGPIFANVLLADEINRTSPKVQAALLEAMGEKQVTVDNHTYPLEDLFFVIATQNPLDLVGTYPLPRAQLDRFLFKIRMTYLSRESELQVLSQWKEARRHPPRVRIAPQAIVAARNIVAETVRVSPVIHECLVDLAHVLRADRRVAQGISTRSLVQAIPALQARAMMQGRDYVSHEDLRELAEPLFAHRLELLPGVKDAAVVVEENARPVLEKAARKTLAR